MKAFLTIKEAANYLSVCTKTIRRWDKAGKIHCHRTPGGHRRIAIVEIERLMTGRSFPVTTRTTAIYSRVSSHAQKKQGDLQRQTRQTRDYCIQQGYQVAHVFQDVGSGLNANRRGLKKLCRVIECGEIDRLVITYEDRLTRFGFDYLVRYFASHGVVIEVVERKASCSMEEELVQDLIAIVTSFSGRVHGLRSRRSRQKRQLKIKEQSSFPQQEITVI